MRAAVLLVQLALWASSTHAFFPYAPAWREEGEASGKRAISGRGDRAVRFDIKQRAGQNGRRQTPDTAAREATRIATKYARRRQLSADNGLAERENQFNIMEADDPGKERTQGVSQDGTDYSYFVAAELGSKGKKMQMLIDTGAGSSWVMGSSCQSTACGTHGTFGPDDSDTMEMTGKPFSISYGTGKVKGSLVKDTITVAGMSFNYQFGLAETTSDQFVQFAFDGILGLGLMAGANENFLQTLDEANEFEKNIFCIDLNRAADGTNEGEIRFGSTNPDKYTGDITYSNLNHGEDWAIKIDDFAYDAQTAGAGGIHAFIDTGTSFIFGPADLVKKVHALIPGASSTDGATYTVPCDSDIPLVVSFAKVSYQISPKDWVSPKNSEGLCTSNVYGHEVVKGAWLMGDTFIKNVYTVFDKDQRRIGFAKKAVVDDSKETSESTSDSKTSSKTGSASKTNSISDSTSTSSSSSTSDDAEGSGSAPSVTAGLGLEKETVATGTATGEPEQATQAAQEDEGDEESSSPKNLLNTNYTFIICMITFIVLLV